MLWVRNMEAPRGEQPQGLFVAVIEVSWMTSPVFIYNFFPNLWVWFHWDCCFIGRTVQLALLRFRNCSCLRGATRELVAVSETVWIAYNIAWGVCCCESGSSGCCTVQMLLDLFGLQFSTPLAWAAQDGFDANNTVVPLDRTISTRGMDGLRKFDGSDQSVWLSGVFIKTIKKSFGCSW